MVIESAINTQNSEIIEILEPNDLKLRPIVGSPNPPNMRRRSELSFRYHIGRDVADHAKTSWRRRNWYVNETDLFETSLRRLTGT